MGRCLNYKEMRFSGFRKGPKIAVTLVTNRGRTAMLTVCQEILSSVDLRNLCFHHFGFHTTGLTLR